MQRIDEWKQLNDTMTWLLDLFSQALQQLDLHPLLSLLERLKEQIELEDQEDGLDNTATLREMIVGLTEEESFHVALATTIWLDLFNIAEDELRSRVLHQRELNNHPAPIEESIQHALGQLKAQGFKAKELQTLLNNLDIELVFTAHPTEIKRRTVLSKFQRIAEQLQLMSNSRTLPREKEEAERTIQEELTSLWLTRRSRTIRPSVTDEVRTGLYILENILWDEIPQVYQTLQDGLAKHYPGVSFQKPWLRIASWMGGDRDGNPNVTAKVTAETLRLHRGLAVEKHRKAVTMLGRHLSVQGDRLKAKHELLQWFKARQPLSNHVRFLQDRYPDELYRLCLGALASDLAEASQAKMVPHLLSESAHKAIVHPEDVDMVLRYIQESMPAPLQGGKLQGLRQQVSAFGLHTARLDIREDSARLNESLGETLRALGECQDFAKLDNDKRTEILLKQLRQEPPRLSPTPGFRPETSQTWALFRLIHRTRSLYGSSLLGPFIISMTQGVADLLAVLLMARWTGGSEGLSIVPLFETVNDLVAAPKILERLFSLPVYRKHLATCGHHQMIMVGYSDSNKDGGFLASKWSLYQAQSTMAASCQKAGISYSFFHGTGGTVARGGGPTNRSIQALPPGTLNGRFRVTEQGEVISARYSSSTLARRQLEQVTSAVLLSSALESSPKPTPEAWAQTMDQLTEHSLKAYRSLVFETPDFLRFWQWVTPIDEISRLRIGSRPATRRGGAVNPGHIRAIPWVFSWMQSRFNLPGWYGVGQAITNSESDQELLRQMYHDWPFFRFLVDSAEMSLVKADMSMASLYVTLATEPETAQRIFDHIQGAYNQTQDAILSVTGRDTLLAHRPVFQRQIGARNKWLRPLHLLQVETLHRLRSRTEEEPTPETQRLRDVMLQTFNGIAAGLRSTG